jgi:hypothetical protein
VEVVGGILQDESSVLMKSFFTAKRNWKSIEKCWIKNLHPTF